MNETMLLHQTLSQLLYFFMQNFMQIILKCVPYKHLKGNNTAAAQDYIQVEINIHIYLIIEYSMNLA